MTLTAKDVAEITRLLEQSNFDELDLEIDGFRIHLTRNGAVSHSTAREAARPATVPAAIPPQPSGASGLTPVITPLLGTFYRAPRPGEPPFVDVGSVVEPETVVGIIEVMKLMTTVRAGARWRAGGIRRHADAPGA
jgi:acetyl-CoA carboxylase biotin carboxyl carrier protein